MPVNMALHTWLAIAPRDDRLVRIRAVNIDQSTEVNLDDIRQDPGGGWQEYPKGVLQVLQSSGFELEGADVSIASSIPIGGGLSSSASLETVMAMAMLKRSGHKIDRKQIALMCKEAENDFVGVACGIMDQYVISLSRKGHAMKLDCRSMEYEQVQLPENARLLVVHSGIGHSLNDGGFNTRLRECRQTVDTLAKIHPEITALRDASLDQLDRNRGTLGDIAFRRGRHVVNEIQRVREACKAMTDDDCEELGRLMNDSHASLKDDFEVSCPELDTLTNIARSCDGVYGSRMVGAGWGGCTVTLADSQHVDRVAAEICSHYGAILGQAPWYHVVQPAEPVHEVMLQ